MPQFDSELNVNLNFEGLVEDFQTGAVMGINKVMADCVGHSKDIVPYDTGTLHNSIQIINFAKSEGDSIIGTWGSRDVNYAIFVEFGTIFMSAQPYLRPSADLHYENLSTAIKEFTDG